MPQAAQENTVHPRFSQENWLNTGYTELKIWIKRRRMIKKAISIENEIEKLLNHQNLSVLIMPSAHLEEITK